MKNLTTQKQKSFTLIEMMVAVTVFSLMVGTIINIFMWGIREQRRALATQKLLDETSYVLEYISRAIRMATKDDIPIKGDPASAKSCLSGLNVNYELTHSDQGIKFRNYKNECQEFYLDEGRLKESKDGGAGLPMTSGAFRINTLKFNLIGQGQDDNLQPRVTIFLDFKSQATGGPSVKIQTTISQRKIDVRY